MYFNMSRRANLYAGFGLYVLTGLLVSGQAQAKPNFTGEWKLDTSKSDFGPMPAPSKRTGRVPASVFSSSATARRAMSSGSLVASAE